MKFERIYSYNPVVDIAQVVAKKREQTLRLASNLPETMRSIVYSNNESVRSYAKLLLAASPKIMSMLQSELGEIQHYRNPKTKIEMVKRLLEKHSSELWAALYESAGKVIIPNLVKEYNIPQDKAEDAFMQASADMFDSGEIERSIADALEGKEKSNSNKRTIFDRLLAYDPSRADDVEHGLQNWLNKGVSLRAKTILLMEHRRRGKDVNLDAEAPEAEGNTFGDLVADPTQEDQFADVEERASRSYDDQALINAGLHRVVKIRDFAKQFAKAKAELGEEAANMPQIAVSEKQVEHLIGLAKLMVQASEENDEVELESLNEQCDRIFGRLEKLETKDSRVNEFNQREDQKRKQYLLPWLGENAGRKSRHQPLLQWSATYAPPTTEELEAYNLTPEDLIVTEQYQDKINKRNKKLENKRDKRRTEVDFLDQQSAYDRMDQARAKLMPHLYRSWEYPGLDAKERARLKQTVGGGLLKPISELNRGIGHPETASELFGENIDYSQMDKERLWSHLLMDAAMSTHDKTLFDIKNNIKLPKGTDKVAITRFVEHIKTSPIYQIDPKFFQAKLEAFMSKSSTLTALNQRIDVYTRAGSYEQARYDAAAGKPWGELTPEDKDAMAMYVWNNYYRDGFRQFRTIRDTDSKEEPTAPLAKDTDVTDYLYRIRAEIERIARGDKKWVSTSTAEQANNKGHNKTEYVKKNTHDTGDHTGDYKWIQTGLWNDNGPLFNNQQQEPPVEPQGMIDDSELDMPGVEANDAPHLHAYSVKELVRFAQAYDDDGMYDEADLVDSVINQKLAEWSPKLSVRFVAANESTRSKGLMFSTPLEPNEVALFVFEKPARYAFWNKNVTYPLSLAFLDSEGDIVDFADLEAYQSENVMPRMAAKYVVEAPKGTFRSMGISVGDRVSLGTKEVTILRTAQKLTKFANK